MKRKEIRTTWASTWVALAIAACSSSTTPTTSDAGSDAGAVAVCTNPDASVKPIALAGINPWAIAPTTDGTRVLVSVTGEFGSSYGGLSANEADAGIQSLSVSTKQSLGIAPAETATVSGDAGSKVTVGWYSAIAVHSATRAYVVANSLLFDGSRIYKFDPTTGGSVIAVPLSSARGACSLGELALDIDGGRLFASCQESVPDAGLQVGVVTVNTTTDSETAGDFISTPKRPQSVAVFPADGGTLLIAMTDDAIGSLGRVSLGATLGTMSLATSTLGKDPVVRVVSSGTTTHVVALNRGGMSGGTGTNSVQFLDPGNNFETKKIGGSQNDMNFSTGQGTNPVDVVAGSPSELWVSLLNVPDGGIVAMNTTSGALTKSIDLVSFASCGYLPRASAMAVVGDRIWVTLQNSSASYAYGPGKIVILNPTTGALEAAP